MGESAAPDTTALDELFQSVNRSDAPGLVVGVAHHGKTVYRRAFGLASVELSVANTPWTRMRIGSTSKHFTCQAALLLAEDGLIDIDASVRRYIPELPPRKAEPTLRQLMSNTGGQRCYLDVGFLSDRMAIKPRGVALATLLRQGNHTGGAVGLARSGGRHLRTAARRAQRRPRGRTREGPLPEHHSHAPLAFRTHGRSTHTPERFP